MKTIKFLIFIFIASMAMTMTSCSKEDNPVGNDLNLDDPQEVVTDQPAYSRTN